MNDYLPSSKKRHRRRSFSCSDELWERIKNNCKDSLSVSSFIRKAVEKCIK